MTDSSSDTLNARLDAHRRLLVHPVASLDRDARQAAIDWLRAETILRDGQEDSGVVPSEGLGSALFVVEDNRLILRVIGDRIYKADHG